MKIFILSPFLTIFALFNFDVPLFSPTLSQKYPFLAKTHMKMQLRSPPLFDLYPIEVETTKKNT